MTGNVRIERSERSERTESTEWSETIESMIQHSFDSEGSFQFRCNACGKRCQDREDILLTPYDLNRIAQYLDIPMGKVVQDYCVCYVGTYSRLPIVAVNMKGPEKICPFLKERKCRIHAAKPTVCALYPLGRVGAYELGGIPRYFIQNVSCGAKDETHTVREWLTGYGLEESENWFREWQKLVVSLAERLNAYGPVLTGKMQSMIGEVLLSILYIHYENDRDFMEQFLENAGRANGLLDMIDETMRQFDKR